jgi:glycosyltransferase involved in cell wall biosynthesis
MSNVDVVIPCYNYARYLKECVGSVLSQNGVEVRALIIDDCSTDDTEAVGRQLVEQDKRVEYRRHSTNRGHIATYNEGLLEWADRDYVLLLSADDMLAPGALARAARIIDNHSAVALCYGKQIVFDSVPPTVQMTDDTFSFNIMSGREFLDLACNGGDNPVPTPTAIVRRSVQHSAGGYKAELPHAGDLEMWLRCAARGQVAKVNQVQAFKREHSHNMLKQFTPTILPDLRQRKQAFESAFRECASLLEDADELLSKAKRSLSNHAFWGAHTAFVQGQNDFTEALLCFCEGDGSRLWNWEE